MSGETGLASVSSGTFASCETIETVAPCAIELKSPAPHVEPPDCDWPVASSWSSRPMPDLFARVTSTP